jgi:hypothetical protein
MRAHLDLLVKKSSELLEHDLVDVAPAPIFARLEGLDNRVVGRVEMLCSVFVFRRIAAADVPADEALAQVHPGVANPQAILTAVCARRNISYLVKVCTLLCH